MDDTKASPAHSSNELAEDRTHIAHERTDMALERTDLAFSRSSMASDRTLMAVMRTSVSLIGFGFTLYKFFEYMRAQPGFEKISTYGPRNLGMAMVLLGAVLLAISTWQHVAYVHKLAALANRRFRFRRPWSARSS